MRQLIEDYRATAFSSDKNFVFVFGTFDAPPFGSGKGVS